MGTTTAHPPTPSQREGEIPRAGTPTHNRQHASIVGCVDREAGDGRRQQRRIGT